MGCNWNNQPENRAEVRSGNFELPFEDWVWSWSNEELEFQNVLCCKSWLKKGSCCKHGKNFCDLKKREASEKNSDLY